MVKCSNGHKMVRSIVIEEIVVEFLEKTQNKRGDIPKKENTLVRKVYVPIL